MMTLMIHGAASIAIAVAASSTTVPAVKIFEMNALPPSSPATALTICGTRTAVSTPTEMIENTSFGSWFARANASGALPTAPITPTSTIVRNRPVIRDTMVPAARTALARPRLLMRLLAGGRFGSRRRG